MLYMSYLEKNIKEVLQQKKKTLSWLATQLGYSRQGLSNGLSNKTIKFDTIERITNVLEIPLGSILGESIITYDDPEKEKIIQSLKEKKEEFKEKINLLQTKVETNEAKTELYRMKFEIKKNGFDFLFDFVMNLNGFQESDIIKDSDALKRLSDPIKEPLLYLSSIRYIFDQDGLTS